MNCSATSPSTTSLRTVLSATTRSMCGSTALYTTPIAPRPSTPWISYLPRRAGSVMERRRQRSRLEHLHGLHEARFHAAERFGEGRDLVLAAALDPARLEIAEAHLVGERGQPGHRTDDHRVQHE